MDTDATIEMLRYRLQQAIARCDIKLELDTQYPPIPPFESDIDSDLVQTLAKYSGNMPGTVAFGTEGHFLKSLGMETVVFGPGSIDQAHTANEFVDCQQVLTAHQVYRSYMLSDGVLNAGVGS